MATQNHTFSNLTRPNGATQTGKPVLIQVHKSQLWRTILCAQGQKG
jgi:hypothetical protein